MMGGLAVRKFLVLIFALAGIGFPQQAYEIPSLEVVDRHIEWCE